jgi:hypothetical protein
MLLSFNYKIAFLKYTRYYSLLKEDQKKIIDYFPYKTKAFPLIKAFIIKIQI